MSVRIVCCLSVLACLVGTAPRLFADREPPPRATAAPRDGDPNVTLDAARLDAPVDEMLHTRHGRWERWTEVPELVVLTSVMDYRRHDTQEYRATAERLREPEVDALVADLTRALSELSGHTIVGFAAVHRLTIEPGSHVPIIQTGRIVAGRFRGVREAENTLGLGGRQTRRDGTISAAAVLLDAEFDSTSRARRLSRTHELGHALGFNHVTSRVSVMNTHIGTEPTDVDRQLARLAFSRALGRE